MGASLGQPSLRAVILSDRGERRIPSWSYSGFPKDKLEIPCPRCARPQNDAGGFGREIKSAPSVNHTLPIPLVVTRSVSWYTWGAPRQNLGVATGTAVRDGREQLEEQMGFDIHQLDEIDSHSAAAEDALEEYQDALLERFFRSREGEAYLKAHPEGGFWAAQLMYYGYTYVGVTLPQMTVADVEEIVTQLFPRKISLPSPDDAKDAITELVAFWEYLKREYGLPEADSIRGYLRQLEPEFTGMMYDPSRFGMAKSLFMMGQSAGFDMTKKEDMNAFMQVYNASQMAKERGLAGLSPGVSGLPGSRRVQSRRKGKRKAAKAARKKQRRKR
jgi:hypothetical protein